MKRSFIPRYLPQQRETHLDPWELSKRGRSRFWRDDRGWFVIGVEFQPSSWSRGSYLNVGCNWLWKAGDYFSYDVGGRVSSFKSVESPQQFKAEAEIMTERAAEEVRRFRIRFPNVRSVSNYYLQQKADVIWPHFDGAIACALSGDQVSADFLFDKVIESSGDEDWAKAARSDAMYLKSLLQDVDVFRCAIVERIKRARKLQKLPEIQEFGL